MALAMRCSHLKQMSNDNDEHDEDDNDEDDVTQHSNNVLMVDEPTDNEAPEPRSTCPRSLRSPVAPSPPPPAAAGRRKRYHIEEEEEKVEEEGEAEEVEEEDEEEEEGM